MPLVKGNGVRLKRELGLLHATMMGIGGAVSAGVFVTLGYAASLAGVALIVAMILCGVINLFTMMSYAELGTALPVAGGEYSFVKFSFGGFLSFATGWFEWISNIFFASFSAIGFGNLLSYAMPFVSPPLVAIMVISIFTIINIKGIKETGKTQTILVLILLMILIFFIFSGLSSNQSTLIQASSSGSLLGVLRASAFIFVIYLGGEAIAAAQAEIKNPRKTIPRAIIISSLALIILYTFISYVIFKIVPPESLAGLASPISFVAKQLMGNLGLAIITIAGVIAALTSVNTSLLAQSRVAYAMARDGNFPKWCFSLHQSFCTPHIALILGGVIAAVMAATGTINFLTYATDFGFIIGFIFVNLSLMKLRRDKPNLKRPFKVPLYPATPILGILTCLFLIVLLDHATLVMGAALFIVAVTLFKIKNRYRPIPKSSPNSRSTPKPLGP